MPSVCVPINLILKWKVVHSRFLLQRTMLSKRYQRQFLPSSWHLREISKRFFSVTSSLTVTSWLVSWTISDWRQWTARLGGLQLLAMVWSTWFIIGHYAWYIGFLSCYLVVTVDGADVLIDNRSSVNMFADNGVLLMIDRVLMPSLFAH